MKPLGRNFEKWFLAEAKKVEGIWVYQFPDMVHWGPRVLWIPQPADFLILTDKSKLLLELKSTKDNTFTKSRVKSGQISSLSSFHNSTKNALGFFCIYFQTFDKFIWIDAKNYETAPPTISIGHALMLGKEVTNLGTFLIDY